MSGFNPTSSYAIDRLIHFLNAGHQNLDRAIQDLENTELNWRPSPSSNSIGNLLAHILGAETFWIHHVVGKFDVKRDRPSEFVKRDFDMAILTRTLVEVKSLTEQIITRLTDEQLNESRMFSSQRFRQEKETSVYWAIMHIIEHNALHTGQIFYIRKMYANRSMQEP